MSKLSASVWIQHRDSFPEQIFELQSTFDDTKIGFSYLSNTLLATCMDSASTQALYFGPTLDKWALYVIAIDVVDSALSANFYYDDKLVRFY